METQVGTQTWEIDRAHSRLGFTVRHMGFAKVKGRFEDFSGTVEMEPGGLESLRAKVTIDTQTVTTNDEKRDEHLRSEDFFQVKSYPQITFESKEVSNVSGNSFTLTGDITIRDVTRTISLDATFLGEGQDPWGGTRVGFEARTKINRKDFGLNWNAVLETGGFLVSDEVLLEMEVQAVLQEDDD